MSKVITFPNRKTTPKPDHEPMRRAA